MATSAFEPSFDGGYFLEQMRGKHIHRRSPPAARAADATQRRAMIAEAAYYRAQRRGFEPGHALEDCYRRKSRSSAHWHRTGRRSPAVSPATIREFAVCPGAGSAQRRSVPTVRFRTGCLGQLFPG